MQAVKRAVAKLQGDKTASFCREMSGREVTGRYISIPVFHGTLLPMDFWTPPRCLIEGRESTVFVGSEKPQTGNKNSAQSFSDQGFGIPLKLASILDSRALKPSCNFLRFLAMYPPVDAFFCRKAPFFWQESAFFYMHFRQENAFFCRKTCIFL